MNPIAYFRQVRRVCCRQLKSLIDFLTTKWNQSPVIRRLIFLLGGYISAPFMIQIARSLMIRMNRSPIGTPSLSTSTTFMKSTPLVINNSVSLSEILDLIRNKTGDAYSGNPVITRNAEDCSIEGGVDKIGHSLYDQRSAVSLSSCGKMLISRKEVMECQSGNIETQILSAVLIPGSLQKISEILLDLYDKGVIKSLGIEYEKKVFPLLLITRRLIPPIVACMGWYILMRSMISNREEDHKSDFVADKRNLIPKVTFNEVIMDEMVLVDMTEIVDFIKNPDAFTSQGVLPIRGVLLHGPSGTGKTLLARAMSGEAGIPFLAVSGAELVDTYVGRGANRVRKLFERARVLAPSIVFIDEIDAIGDRRSAHEEYVQTINQLLTELDGVCGNNDGVCVVVATNRISSMDISLKRPGRFDRHIKIEMPGMREREQILRVHSSRVSLQPSVKLSDIASDKLTKGFTGADLANLVNEAAYIAMRRSTKSSPKDGSTEVPDRLFVTKEDLEAAVVKCRLLVSERKDVGIKSPTDFFRTAFG